MVTISTPTFHPCNEVINERITVNLVFNLAYKIRELNLDFQIKTIIITNFWIMLITILARILLKNSAGITVQDMATLHIRADMTSCEKIR